MGNRTTDVINASIDEVLVTFLETTLLVVLVIFLFLQNWRAVIIPCITIPVSLIGTLAVMAALGFSINTLTLFGLILAVAIVVDDAIVVVENASRLRIYQVKIEAGEQAQKVIDDVLKLSVPNAKGDMVPFSSFTKVEERLGMDQISRYNMYSTASITCNVASGSSSGEGIQQMEDLIKEQLGNEFGYEWTSVAYQETQAGNTTTIVFIMALLVAFLVLAAQYEPNTNAKEVIRIGRSRTCPAS